MVYCTVLPIMAMNNRVSSITSFVHNCSQFIVDITQCTSPYLAHPCFRIFFCACLGICFRTRCEKLSVDSYPMIGNSVAWSRM